MLSMANLFLEIEVYMQNVVLLFREVTEHTLTSL